MSSSEQTPHDTTVEVPPLGTHRDGPMRLDEQAALSSLERAMFPSPPARLRLGRYEVGERIGAGAIGVVYAGRDPELERDVAIKLMREDLATGNAAARFVREARALARLDHPNVVRVFDVGTAEGSVFGAEGAYIVMERLRGTTLDNWARRSEPSWREVVRAYLQAGRGIAAAHDAGLLHRDFKPSNAMIDEHGHVKVLDFGLARERGTTREDTALAPGSEEREETLDDRLTRQGSILGTVHYMPPEQRRGEAIDAAADQFALCASLLETMVGEERAKSVRAGDDRPLPASIRRAVRRGLATNPAERWPSMHALLDALESGLRMRRNVVGAGVVAAAVAAGAWGFQVRSEEAGLDDCREGADAIALAWNADAHRRVEERLRSTGVPYAETTLAHVTADLDAFADNWTEARMLLCEQPEQTRSLNRACLADARHAFEAATYVLERADAGTVERAGELVGALPQPGACLAPTPPASVLLGRHELSGAAAAEMHRLEAFQRVGRYQEAADSGRALAERLSSGDEVEAHTAALLQLGCIEGFMQDWPNAYATTERAYYQAVEHEADVLAARAASRLVGLSSRIDEDGGRWAAEAEAWIERVDGGPALDALLHENLGTAALNAGKLDDAERHFRLSVAGWERARGPENLAVASPLQKLALVPLVRGEPPDEQTLERLRRSLAIRQRALGADHPALVSNLSNLAALYVLDDRPEEAKESFERALELAISVHGEQTAIAARLRSNLGEVELRRGKLPEAFALVDEAYAVMLAAEPGADDLTTIRLTRGQVLLELGELERAHEDLEAVRASETHPARGAEELGWLELAREDAEAATEHFTQAIELAKKAYGADSVRVANAHLGRALARWRRGESAGGWEDMGASLTERVELPGRLWAAVRATEIPWPAGACSESKDAVAALRRDVPDGPLGSENAARLIRALRGCVQAQRP